MKSAVFQCVPNLSEGRRLEVVEEAARALASVPGIKLLDYSADSDHNRSVFTFIGPAEPVAQAVYRLYEVADRYVDLNTHQGAHPRLGAVDVVPFVPLEGTAMAQAVELSEQVAAEVARRWDIPVYLYENSARCEERRSLAFIRKGGFESLLALDKLKGREPDMGPLKVHPRLGASVLGARNFLVAYNVVLDSADVEVARSVARKVRESSGGLPYVRALGIYLKSCDRAQVSMNLLQCSCQGTPIYVAFEKVKAEAAKLGVKVLRGELIGALPLQVLAETAAFYLSTPEITGARVLERGLLDMYRSEEE